MKKVFTPDVWILLIGCVIIELLMYILLPAHASTAVVECFSNEPKMYILDVRDQESGPYYQLLEFETGPKAGTAYAFNIKDLSKPDETTDYIKQSCPGCKHNYKMLYSLKCSKPMKPQNFHAP